MKKIFLFLSILLISTFAYNQSTTSVFSIPDSITQFKTILPSGQIVFDKQSNNLWSLTSKAINTQSLATSVKTNLGGSANNSLIEALKDSITKNELLRIDTVYPISGWQQKGNMINHSWSKIASDGQGHMVAISTNDWYVQYSSDGGNTWTSYNLSMSGTVGYISLTDIVYGNGKFVICGDNGGFYYSTDNGQTFNTSNAPANSGYAQFYHTAITFGNGKFVSTIQGGPSGGLCHYSTDGITWSLGQLDPTGIQQWNDICFDDVQGYFYAVSPGNDGLFSKSSDGITWTAPVQCAFSGAQRITARDGHIYIMATYGTNFTYSDNAGVTWSQSTLSTSLGWSTLCYAKGHLFIAAGGAGPTYHLTELNLTDHSTVTPVTLGEDMNFHDLIYVNNEFVVLSGGDFDHERTKAIATFSTITDPTITKIAIKDEINKLSHETYNITQNLDSLKAELVKTNIIVSGEPVIFKEVGSINNCVVTVYMGLAPKNMMSVKYLITRNGNTAYGTLYFIRSLTGAFIVKDQDRVTEGYEGNVDYGSISFHQVPTYDTGTIMYLEVTINNTSYNANIKFYDYKKL